MRPRIITRTFYSQYLAFTKLGVKHRQALGNAVHRGRLLGGHHRVGKHFRAFGAICTKLTSGTRLPAAARCVLRRKTAKTTLGADPLECALGQLVNKSAGQIERGAPMQHAAL